jgi:amino acid transporter
MDAAKIAASRAPYFDALKGAAPALTQITEIAADMSIASCLIAAVNSQARIMFSSGREGLLPKRLGCMHPRRRTPHVAIATFLLTGAGCALTGCLLIGLAPLDYFAVAGTLGTIPIILTYLIANLALPVYVLRQRRRDFNVLRHLVTPIFGTAVIALPLWGLIQGGKAWPFNALPGLTLAVLAACAIYGLIISRLSPGLAHQIGAHIIDR